MSDNWRHPPPSLVILRINTLEKNCPQNLIDKQVIRKILKCKDLMALFRSFWPILLSVRL